jgi:hypothetical protein
MRLLRRFAPRNDKIKQIKKWAREVEPDTLTTYVESLSASVNPG